MSDEELNLKASVEGAALVAELAKEYKRLQKAIEDLKKSSSGKEDRAAARQAADELRASAINLSVARKDAAEKDRETRRKEKADREAYNREFAALLKEEIQQERQARAQQERERKEAARAKKRQAQDELDASARSISAQKKDATERSRLAKQQAKDELDASARTISVQKKDATEREKIAKAATKEKERAARAEAAAARELARADAAAARAAARTAAALERARQVASRSATSVGDLIKQVLGLATAFEGFRAFRNFVEEGLEFNKMIERTSLGIAALITAQTTMTDRNGQFVEGVDKLAIAQSMAAEQTQKLRIAGLQTTATTTELTYAFQQAVGVGLRWGMTLDQIRVLSIRMAQAAGALGMPMNQLNEEIRSLLSGTINTRNTRIATALGITNEQIRVAQRAGTLFDFINKKLEAFAIAGEATAKSFAGVMSNIREAMQNLAGDATRPLFETLKFSGQRALEDLFDLKNARISNKFRGILSVAQDTFGTMADMLADAIDAGMSGAEDLNNWMGENRGALIDILAVIKEIGTELGFITADVIGVAGALTEVSVEAGVVKTVFAGIGLALAVIRETFQWLLGAAALLGNILLRTVVGTLAQADILAGKLVSVVNKDLGKQLEDIGQEGMKWLDSLSDGLAQYNKQLVSGGLAIDQYVDRLQKGQEAAAKLSEAQAKRQSVLIAAQDKELHDMQILDKALADEKIKQGEYAKKSAEVELAYIQKQIKAQKDFFNEIDAGNVSERRRTIILIQELQKRESAIKRGVTMRSNADPESGVGGKDSALKRLQGLQAEIKAHMDKELAIIKAGLDEQKFAYSEYYRQVQFIRLKAIGQEIKALEDYKKTLSDKGAIDKVTSQIEALNEKREQVVVEETSNEKKAYKDLGEEVLRAHIDLLRDQGRLVEAANLETGGKFRELIAQLRAEVRAGTKGADKDLSIVEQMFGIHQARVALDELMLHAREVQQTLSTELSNIGVQAKTNAITERQAREKVADAYREAKEQLLEMLPAMKAQARLTGDKTAIDNVKQLTIQIQEMDIAIQQASDSFLKLRVAGQEAIEEGLANFLDQAVEGAKSLKDVWIEVAADIVAALRRVATQMLANLIIQRAMQLLGGLFGSAGGGASSLVGVPLSGGPLAGGAVASARGGYIRGPGTATSDSIPAWLSTGEYVVRAAAVQAFGREALDEINKQGKVSVRSYPRTRAYAEGGLVTAASGVGQGGFDATLGLEDGLVVRHLKSKEGTNAIINAIGANRKTVRSLLGPK